MVYSTQTEIETLITAAKVTELSKAETVAIVVPSTVLSIAIGAVNGYALSFWRPRGAGLLFAILLSLTISAWPAISKYGLGFLTSTAWDPVQEEFGGLVMIYGTLATSLIALLIAVPVSFGIALFLTELSPNWLRRPLGVAVELLAAVRADPALAALEELGGVGRVSSSAEPSAGRPFNLVRTALATGLVSTGAAAGGVAAGGRRAVEHIGAGQRPARFPRQIGRAHV